MATKIGYRVRANDTGNWYYIPISEGTTFGSHLYDAARTVTLGVTTKLPADWFRDPDWIESKKRCTWWVDWSTAEVFTTEQITYYRPPL